jgi:hypothetical protein
MKDKELNLEEIETSHTLGGTGEGRVGEGGEDTHATLIQKHTVYPIGLESWSDTQETKGPG